MIENNLFISLIYKLMIPFVGNVGRVALTQAGRQIGREFGREVLERVIGGETLGQILTREEMKVLAR